jgi:outer membrane receptor protein involved in Fe transport
MLEAIPNVLTAQHTGGGKVEQYFVRGFDADHGTDLAVYFDGVPVNLRSHAHGQGFLDLRFVTPETIDRLDATKGPYDARYGDFATAATIEYVPAASMPESQIRASYGEFDTFRAVGVFSPRHGAFESGGPARGFLSFEAYQTNGPFENDENLERYSAMARGEIDLRPDLTISGHVLGYYANWDASGFLPNELVRV